jgi:hypothetical protein
MKKELLYSYDKFITLDDLYCIFFNEIVMVQTITYKRVVSLISISVSLSAIRVSKQTDEIAWGSFGPLQKSMQFLLGISQTKYIVLFNYLCVSHHTTACRKALHVLNKFQATYRQ